MLARAGLVSSCVVGLSVWQANKVHAEASTSQQTTKKKIRPSEVLVNFDEWSEVLVNFD